MTTTRTVRAALNQADLSEIQYLLNSKVKLGDFLSTVKAVFAGVTGAASYDITTAAMKALATITGIELGDGENLPPIRFVRSLRVTAATTANSVGSYAITDASGTVVTPTAGANLGIAKLSDDGKTLTFASADVTAFVIEYGPLPATDLDATAESY